MSIRPEYIWGINPLLEGLRVRPQQFKEIIIHKKKLSTKLKEIVKLAESRGLAPVFASDESIYGKKAVASADLQHQGVTARIKPFALLSLNDLLVKNRAAERPPLLMVLDSIQDPRNMGALIRSGLAAGVSGVIVPKDRSASLGGVVAKASAGAIFHVDICRVTNLAAAIQKLKKDGIWIFGTVKDGGRSIYEADFSIPSCLVIGSEGKGIRPLLKEKCDFLVSIPMQGGLDSLNSSVAAAVILFEAVRQRTAG